MLKSRSRASASSSFGRFARSALAFAMAAQASCVGSSNSPSVPLNPPMAKPAPSLGALSCGAVPGPEEGPIRGSYSEGQIPCLCQAAIDQAKARFDAIAALPPERRTFENTLLALELANAEFSDATNQLYFMKEVSPDPRTHEEATACAEKLEEFGVETGARRDLYLAVKDQAPDPQDADFASLERLRKLTVLGYEQGGMKLSDEGLERLKGLQQKLSELQQKYSGNLGRDRSEIVVAAEEAEGLPSAFLERQAKDEAGRYRVPMNEPNYVEVIQKAKNPDVRKRAMISFTNRGGQENVELLNQAVRTRADIARLLGYANYADQAIDGRMAKDSATVTAFLEDLRVKLQPRIRREIADLLEYKRRLEPNASRLEPWDVNYLSYQIKKNELQVDDDQVREYFPADVVTRGIFDTYSQLLSLKFVEVAGAKPWSPDVKLYAIQENREGQGRGETIGYFYADLAPRPLKYNHAAAFSLIQGRRLPDGRYNMPVSAIVANFTPGAGGRAPLLRHDEVQTFFHEFGHIMHQTLTRARFASLSGTSVARDFVEAPSQMLENWVWEPSVLERVSGHYQDPSRKLPQGLLEKMLRARDFGKGSFYAKQALYARFDMALHSLRPGDSVEAQSLYDRMYEETVGMPPLAGNRFAANFGHLMGGYAAGYYGYLWSDVFASDMFTQFAGDKLLDPSTGARYRSEILEKGNMQDAAVLVERFLGRKPSNAAFLGKLGISTDGTFGESH